jgi:hypothetical protein
VDVYRHLESSGEFMKALISFVLLGILSLVSGHARAQGAPQEKPGVPVKIQIVFSEFEGEKKISSMPYSFIAITDEKVGGYYSTSLRTGVRIPVEIDGKDQKATYMDVGSNIDFGIRTTTDDSYHLYMIFERSALYPSTSDDKLPAHTPGQPPLVRQFKASENIVLKDGQTSESVVSTDPLNGHSLHISVTINLVK